MKRALEIVLVLVLMVGSVMTATAQRRTVTYLPKYESEPYHFGFLLGINVMDYAIRLDEDYQNQKYGIDTWPEATFAGIYGVDSISIYSMESRKWPGFTVGIIADKRIGQFFNVRVIPTFSLNSKTVYYTIAGHGTGLNGADTLIMRHPESKNQNANFVEMPIQVKYRSKRYNNIGAYIIGGVNPKIDLSSRKKLGTTDEHGNFTPKALVTKRFDLALEIGTGFDFYNQWFKMGVEAKMAFGMPNILNHDEYFFGVAVKNLKNRQFQISFTFE